MPEPGRLVAVRAGALSGLLADGELRRLSVGGVEVLRRLYFAFRDPDWGTVPWRIREARVEPRPRSFSAVLDCTPEAAGGGFDFHLEISGGEQGSIEASLQGRARGELLAARVGFCLLYPPGCAGRDCRYRPAGKDTDVAASLPLEIAPHQPLPALSSLSVSFDRGLRLDATLEGEVFEMEDQRNWTDASFKLYSTPLDRPRPIVLEAGSTLSQRVRLALRGPAAGKRPARSRATAGRGARLEIAEAGPGRVPPLGPDLTYQLADPAVSAARLAEGLRPLGAAIARADIQVDHPSWEARLSCALTASASADVPLLLVLLTEGDGVPARLPDALAAVKGRLAGIGITRVAPPWDSSPAMIAALRAGLARAGIAAPLGAGTVGNFAELNRRRPDGDYGFCFYAASPQLHLFDDDTLIENVEGLEATLRSAAVIAGGRPVHVGPVTLRPRFYAASAARAPIDRPQFAPDPRLREPLGCLWTAAAVAALAGAEGATFHELSGPGGLLDGSPALALLFAELAGLAGAPVRAVRCAPAPDLAALVVERAPGLRAYVMAFGSDGCELQIAAPGMRVVAAERLEPASAAWTAVERLPAPLATRLSLPPQSLLRLELEGR